MTQNPPGTNTANTTKAEETEDCQDCQNLEPLLEDSGIRSECLESSETGESLDSQTEMALEQCQAMIEGMLNVLTIRLDSANERRVGTFLSMYWQCERYVQMLTLTRVLQCHYKPSHPLISEALEQISELLVSIVEELGLRNDPDYLVYSLEGALEYIQLCFRDDKLTNSNEVTTSLCKHFTKALKDRDYYRMYGMLLSFQTLFQQPEKSVVYDIIYEHLVALCPELEDDDESV